MIFRLDMADRRRAHLEKHRDRIVGRLEHRRELPEFRDSRDKRAIADRPYYETWRDGTDAAAAAAEGVLANHGEYAIHLDGMARRGRSLALTLACVRGVLRDDDRHFAASLAG